MNKKYILDDLGLPIPEPDLMAWARWMERGDRIVAKTPIGDARVSTVFLGLDHSWGEGDPVLFETMIFGGEHDQYQERYTTRTEAMLGHTRAVRMVTGG